MNGFDAGSYVVPELAVLPPELFIPLLVWTLLWKGLALWHAAHRNEQWWFIAILLINTAGILEIIYLFFVAKKKFTDLFPIGKIE